MTQNYVGQGENFEEKIDNVRKHDLQIFLDELYKNQQTKIKSQTEWEEL